jgi:membrane protease YdiL (CAAX protease family)
MKSRNVLLFYGLTFILCWGIAALFVVFPEPLEAAFGPMGMYNPVFILYAYMPALIALILSVRLEGRAGLQAWLGRCLRWQVSPLWYLLILIGLPTLAYLAALLSGQSLSFDPQVILLAIFPGMLVGPLSEEPGWHGYALPHLLKSNSLFRSGLITGVLWGIWHLPAYILSGTPQEAGNPLEAYVGFVLVAIGLNLLQAWIFSHTGGSALVAGILCHLAYNTSMELAGDPHLWMGILLLIAAGITVLVDRVRFLSPQPLAAS